VARAPAPGAALILAAMEETESAGETVTAWPLTVKEPLSPRGPAGCGVPVAWSVWARKIAAPGSWTTIGAPGPSDSVTVPKSPW